MKRLSVLIPIAYACVCSLASGQEEVIQTVAGDGSSTVASGGPATAVLLAQPGGVAVDASGNIFISDTNNSRILKVSGGTITTVVGFGGLAASPGLLYPAGIALDAAGDLFIADYGNSLVRKVLAGGNNVITVAGGGGSGYVGDGGLATSALLDGPSGVAVDASGNVFIADTLNNVIREVTASTGDISTVAGNYTLTVFGGDGGAATSAELYNPTGVFIDTAGNLFIADRGNNRIRKATVGGNINTVAGNGTAGHQGDSGPATSAELYSPTSVVEDASGNLFIAGTYNDAILEVSAASGNISTVAGLEGTSGYYGDGMSATSALLNHPAYAVVDASGDLFIADTGNSVIREVSASAVPAPSITPNGVVAVDSTVTTIQQGEWVSVYGKSLGPTQPVTWTGNFPQALGGTSVTIDGTPAYLSYVSPTQINLQAPDDMQAGSVPVTVKTAGGSFTSTVTLAKTAPSFLLFDSKHVTGIILREPGAGSQGPLKNYDFLGPGGDSLPFPTVAAKAGDTVALYAVGLGPTTPVVPAGQLFTGGAAPTVNAVKVLINNVSVVNSAAFSESLCYQINITIPAGLGTGDVPLVANVGGSQTPTGVVISLQ